MIELTTTISGNTLGHSWIVGSTTNGIVGTNLNTEDGQQQVVGSAGRGQAISRVVNPKNIYREFFRDTDFQDSTSPNTADWDTTNFRLAMHFSTMKNRAYNTVATSETIFLNDQTVQGARFDADETKFGNDIIKYYLSANNGVTWEEVVKGVLHQFATTGTNLKYRIVFIGNGASETFIENIKIAYEVAE